MKNKRVYFLIFFIFIFTFIFKINTTKASDTGGCENDTIAPELTGYKDWNLLLGQDLPDFKEGITITDNCEIEPTLSVITNYIKINQVGTYKLIYMVTDSNSNVRNVTVHVTVKEDITPPEFYGIKELNIEVKTAITKDLFLKDVTAIDLFDGDITEKIQVDYSKVNTEMVGTYEVIYSVIDNNLNKTIKIINVNILDRTKPNVTITSPIIEVLSTSINWLDYLTVVDNYDPNPVISYIDTVDLNKIGKYFIYFTITDQFNNETQVEMEVKVVDTTKPIVSVSNQEVEIYGDEIQWLDIVHVSDNYDSTPTIRVDYSTVLYDIVGTYFVHYTVIDSSNNTTVKTIEVKVTDKIKPEIMNISNFEILIGSVKPNWLQQVYVVDNYDRIGIDKIIVDDKHVNLNKEGIYPLTYSVMDSSGNTASKTVYVRVFDDIPPVLNGLKDFNIAITSKNIDYLTGVSAEDNLNGDLSNQINYDDNNINYNKVGVYKLRYFVSDMSGNISEEFVTVYVNYDLQKPVIFGTINRTLEINTTVSDWLDGVYVYDDYDQELTIHVDLSKLDVTKTGEYLVTYSATDDASNTGVMSIVITVVDTKNPDITGYKNYTVEINSSLPDLLEGVTGADNSGEELDIVVSHQIEINKLGDYEVTYTTTDSSGNIVTKKAVVRVVDTTNPVITGFKNIEVEWNSQLPSLLKGVTVTDNSEEQLNIVVNHQIELNKLGNYTVTFTATDSSGNSSTKTILVKVVDTTSPVFNGIKNRTIKKGEDFKPLDGITALDNGIDITDQVEVDGKYNLKKPGEYKIKLSVTDLQGHTTVDEYTLIVKGNGSGWITTTIICLVIIGLGVGIYISNKKYHWINGKNKKIK